ncbi:MAG TPA: hypothetical protein VII91_09465 [Bauldia sp.]
MKIKELEQAVDRFGGALGRWPTTLRAEAEALIANDRTAAAIFDVAARLDGALARAMEPMALDAALMGRIVAGLDNGLHHQVAVRPTRRLVAWAGAAMVAFLVTGYAVGLALPTTQDDDTIATVIFGDSAASVDGNTATSDSGSLL